MSICGIMWNETVECDDSGIEEWVKKYFTELIPDVIEELELNENKKLRMSLTINMALGEPDNISGQLKRPKVKYRTVYYDEKGQQIMDIEG